MKTTPTTKELIVVDLISRGLTSKEASEFLELVPSTIRNAIDRTCYKLGAKNRCHLVRLCFEKGYLPRDFSKSDN